MQLFQRWRRPLNQVEVTFSEIGVLLLLEREKRKSNMLAKWRKEKGIQGAAAFFKGSSLAHFGFLATLSGTAQAKNSTQESRKEKNFEIIDDKRKTCVLYCSQMSFCLLLYPPEKKKKKSPHLNDFKEHKWWHLHTVFLIHSQNQIFKATHSDTLSGNS